MNGRYFCLLHHNNNKSLLLPQSSLLHFPQDHHHHHSPFFFFFFFFFSPNHCKSQSSSKPPINKSFFLRILDPQSNHLHHFYHLHHFPPQNPLHVEPHQEHTYQDPSFSPSPKDPSLHFHLQYLQQQQQNHSPYPLDQPPKKRPYLLPPPSPATYSSSSLTATVEHATKMEETANHQHRPASRLAVRGGIGEIVEVQGGHIVRSTGRKDRHSKVCTAKGPRDRRVRLSAHTAIQFYDVQDRLGYDRPSKAVDWLIKNAKSAIDELAKLPAWNPNISVDRNSQEEKDGEQNKNEIGVETCTTAKELGENPNNHGCGPGFLPPSTLGAEIADSIKSFFPMETNSSTSSSAIQFQNYRSTTSTACQNNSSSNNNNNNQDLRLSLQSFQDPILLHQPQNQQNEHLFSATTQLGFDGSSFPEEHSRLQRMMAWNNNNGGGGEGGGGGGFIFNSPSLMPMPMPTLPPILFGQSQYLSQRGPLQSSNNNNNNPSIRAWIDSSSSSSIMSDHHNHYLPHTIHHHHHHQSSVSGGIGFDSGGGGGGFSGFRIPARIQGEEEHDGVSDNKPSSASSDSRH